MTRAEATVGIEPTHGGFADRCVSLETAKRDSPDLCQPCASVPRPPSERQPSQLRGFHSRMFPHRPARILVIPAMLWRAQHIARPLWIGLLSIHVYPAATAMGACVGRWQSRHRKT